MRRLAIVALVALSVGVGAPRARAAERTVRLDRSSVAIGERVMVIMENWPTQRSVTITVCGNAARRGSVDCAVTRSQGYGISSFDKLHASSFEVAAPPAPCPCVIQVSNATFSEVAFAPIEIVDHATGAVVAGAVDAPLTVDLDVKRSARSFVGRLRSALGGPTTYAVTVVLTNRVGESLHDVAVTARAGHLGDDQARRVRFAVPTVLSANATWTETKIVTVPAPGLGKVDWTLVATGAGPVATESISTTNWPPLFFAIVLLLVADVGWYAQRRLTRRRAATR